MPRNRKTWWPRWSAGRCRALRHWARAVTLPREVGTLIPPQGVLRHCTLAPPAAPPLARFARDWQTSDALRRENAGGWLFESVDQKCETRRLLTSPRSFAGRGRRPSSDARRVRGQALRYR